MQLSEKESNWVSECLEGLEIVFLAIHGSVLYGLDNENSDIDLKAVYVPTMKQLMYGKSLETFQFKNKELDIEMEVKSLPDFLLSAKSCDTNCIDMLHIPQDKILLDSVLWNELQSYKSDLYAKNMDGVIGYIKVHSKKYTNKIDRLTEMMELRQILEEDKDKHLESERPTSMCRVKDLVDTKAFKSKTFKYISIFQTDDVNEHDYLEICGKKYIFTLSIKDLNNALKAAINKYGSRAKIGASCGIDAKSLSHAVRVLYELLEIIQTGDLKFPLKEATYIKRIKYGHINDVDTVLNLIDYLYNQCMMLLENSDLPEHVDISRIEKSIETYYKSKLIKESL